MAVTVTKAAPAAAIDPIYVGSYGVSGSSTFITVNAETYARKRVRACKLTLSGTYVTGGFALTPSDYGLKEIHAILVIGDANGTAGAGAVPQLTTTGASPNIKLYSATGTELANTTNVANYVYPALIVGI